MSRKIKGNGKHLTFSDRVYIEQELMQGSSFRNMAAGLGKDPSTISKEIRLHCSVAPNGTYRFPHCTACSKYKKCKDIPSPRTNEYYEKRPCPDKIYSAAKILAEYLLSSAQINMEN